MLLMIASEGAAQATPLSRLTDRVFAAWDSTTRPGCAVGVDQGSQPRFARAYGLAEMEFETPNRSETIFEAGSVSKQFTAAAIVLLALDGKLRLDDDVRQHVPEIRGYELVARVSGKSFADFSRDRLFTPLGLARTSWRDDFTRVVKGRAQAYSPTRSGWALDMPFENVHGNGGLLTTVGDLLTWTAMLDKPTATWKAMVDSMHVQGLLTNGDTISYALGLFVDQYRGVGRCGVEAKCGATWRVCRRLLQR